MHEKTARFIIIILCAIGLGAVFYGMAYRNNALFIPGILILVCGYLLIRKRLKESIQKDK